MFRIKQTRNQTTAKDKNVSPNVFSNNNIVSKKMIENQTNKRNIINLQKPNKSIRPSQIKQSFIKKLTVLPQKKEQPHQVTSKVQNQYNVRVVSKLKNQQTTNQGKNINISQMVNMNKQIRPNSKLIKKSSNLQANDNNNVNKVQKNDRNVNIKELSENNLLQKSKNQLVKNQSKIQQKIISKKQIQNKQYHKKEEEKIIKQDNKQSKQEHKTKIQAFQSNQRTIIIKNQQTKQNLSTFIQKKQTETQNEQNQKQKQLNEAMQKIRKRRQTRQKEKKRLEQIQQKQKQNLQKAQEFLAARNQRAGNLQEGLGGMLKLNDQLMHFALAQSIMDLQIKKLLKTKFDQFPNATQIKYQLEELQRIDMSYQMIKYDQHNSLKNGLKNYRIQIFNRIGDLILKSQEQGYSNPNFHILQGDISHNNPHLPQIIRGLPQQNHLDFIKFSKHKQQNECAICLGTITKDQISAQLECRHVFHQKCIKDWILTSANCPTCRYNIKFGPKRIK